MGLSPTVGELIAEPVNTFSGNLTLAATDLEVPARGLPLRLSRTYSARDRATGAFGPGWTSNLEWRLEERGESVTVTRGDGRRDVFRRQADGAYAAPSAVFDTLAKLADGSFALTSPDQVSVAFSPAGALRRVSDRQGNALAFTTDAAGRTAAADAVGRRFAIVYNASGRLARFTDAAGAATR